MMKKPLLIGMLVSSLVVTSPAAADCYADYKAKQDNPLRLHYGVMQVPDSACSKAKAKGQIAARLKADGWTLLTVLSVFEKDGLAAKQESAGDFYLRY